MLEGARRALDAGDSFSADKISAEGKIAPPRRSALRAFAARGVKALDMGSARVEVRDGALMLGPAGGAEGEDFGFSLLIKGPGLSKLKMMVLDVRLRGEGEIALTSGRVGLREGEFFARLPLVLHRPSRGGPGGLKALDRHSFSGYTDSVSAEDSCGITAIIGIGPEGAGLISRREAGSPGAADSAVLVVRVCPGAG
jgi:hypothetical protein